MEAKYYITEDQLRAIYNYQGIFRDNADSLKDLCNTEKSDIQYGFQLGINYMNLSNSCLGMLELHDQIESQNIEQ